MLLETRSLAKEVARNDAQIEQLRVLTGHFNGNGAYKSVMDHNYNIAPYSQQNITNIPTDNVDWNFTQSSWPK